MDLFNCKGALELNKARVEHLDSLNLDFSYKKVFETGCGGRGDITRYLLSKNAIVTLNDCREENIKALLNVLNVNLDYNTWDLNKEVPLDKKFDIIICYGTLYHLNKPEEAIINFSNLCNEFLVISTITSGQNDESINIIGENVQMNNQAGDGYGCRPGRLFIYNTLKKNFKHVYLIKTQPKYHEFPLKFPTNIVDLNKEFRNIFIGSHIKLENDLFVEELINEFTH